MLTAKDLHLGEQFDDAPLIYPTLLKSALFSVVLACFKILEEAAIGLYHHQSAEHCRYRRRRLECDSYFDASVVSRAHFFGFGELQRVLRAGKLAQVFFHPRPPL